MQCSIVFQPWGRRGQCQTGMTVLEAAQKANVEITAFCGGQKHCGKCKVHPVVIEHEINPLSPLTAVEKKLLSSQEQEEGYRLACCALVQGDVIIDMPPESQLKEAVILAQGKAKNCTLHPVVRSYALVLDKPTLQDYRDDLTRIRDGLAVYDPKLEHVDIDYEVLKILPHSLRHAHFNVRVLVYNDTEIIAVLPGTSTPVYGMAVDIGTTTIAAYLCDLKTGERVETASAVNPQVSYGDDVITRVSYCMMHDDGLKTLQHQLMHTLNELAQRMTAKQHSSVDAIAEVVVVGNTVMTHIAFGITPEAIGVSPFISGIQQGITVKARELGLQIMPGGYVYALPSQAGFVGSDHTAVLIAESPYQKEQIQLIIDIGTNGEICLGNSEALYITSCATGPALEGAQIQWGMRAAKGAVEHVVIDPKTLEPSIKIIGEDKWNQGSPSGICGSGIIDVVAQMVSVAIIDSDGNFNKQLQHPRIRINDKGQSEYILARCDNGQDLVITQKDIRAVQLAKAALYAGAKILLKESPFDHIDTIILAGAFGSYIDVSNALRLGLFPDYPAEAVQVVGNAAGIGAQMALLDAAKRDEAEAMARSMHFVETAADINFYTEFGNAMGIPHKKDIFIHNLPKRFACSGQDERKIPEVIRNMSIESSPKALTEAAVQIKETYNLPAVRLPLDLTTEMRAFGGLVKSEGLIRRLGNYRCMTKEDLETLCVDTIQEVPVREVLDCIKRVKNAPVILDIEGPFSILASLMDPVQLFSYLKSEGALIRRILDKMTCFLVHYCIQAIKQGVKVLSFADPSGVMELTGPIVYRDFSGLSEKQFFQAILPYLNQSVVHLCGKVALSMEKAGYIRPRLHRQIASNYLESILALSDDPSVHLVGGGCVNSKQSLPIIRYYDMVN